MLASLTGWIEDVSGPWLYVVAFVMTFAETGTLLFIIPGEITLLIAGAAAGRGDINVVVLAVLACVAAVLGDAVGFWLGARFGPRLETSWLGRKLGANNWNRAHQLIHRRRGLIVLVGRWLGFLRAIMPATAGSSGMRYRQFLPWDLAGAISWAVLCVTGGYLLGENYHKLEDAIGKGGLAVGGVVVVVAFVAWERAKKRRERDAALRDAVLLEQADDQ